MALLLKISQELLGHYTKRLIFIKLMFSVLCKNFAASIVVFHLSYLVYLERVVGKIT